VNPDGLAVVMEADHFCMHWRGVKDNASEDDQQRHAWRVPQDGALRASSSPHQSEGRLIPGGQFFRSIRKGDNVCEHY
jgi:hypothetical protein